MILERSGGDGEFETDDDVRLRFTVTPVDPRVARLTLVGPLVDEPYRLTIKGTSNASDVALLLALEMSGELLPPPALLDRLRTDILSIHEAFPPMTAIFHFPKWVPGDLTVGLTEAAAEQFRRRVYSGLDTLNEKFGPVEIEFLSSFGFLFLDFEQLYHPEVLAELYAAADGVEFAEPNFLLGDGDKIRPNPPTYTFADRSGDCLAGCTSEQSWTFSVTDGKVTLDGSTDGPGSFPAPAVAVGAAGEFLDGEFSGTFPSGDGTPGGDFVMTFLWNDTLSEFRRGDANGDLAVDIADGIKILHHLFLGGEEPDCLDAADSNDDGRIVLGDAVWIFAYSSSADLNRIAFLLPEKVSANLAVLFDAAEHVGETFGRQVDWLIKPPALPVRIHKAMPFRRFITEQSAISDQPKNRDRLS